MFFRLRHLPILCSRGVAEETPAFAILTLKTWELLLKAKLVGDNGNNPRCLYIRETRTTAKGTQSQKRYIRRRGAASR
jgi:hypothetical protein